MPFYLRFIIFINEKNEKQRTLQPDPSDFTQYFTITSWSTLDGPKIKKWIDVLPAKKCTITKESNPTYAHA